MNRFAQFVLAASFCLGPGRFPGGHNGFAAETPQATAPPAPGPRPSHLSTNVLDVLHLAESGVEEPVILAYVDNSQTPFDLSSEDIIYLRDIGISPQIVSAMLRQDNVLRERLPQSTVPNEPLPSPVTNAPPASEPVYVTNAPPQVAYFYDSLAPYGTWVDLDGYGWCWQPLVVVVNHGWRPYCYGGNWLWTDCGWYWHSDYSWGWATFHYGRWHQHPYHGWVWFPDNVWGPGWVCWRYSNLHCGWAPLPPGAHYVAGHGMQFNNATVGVNFDFHLSSDKYTYVDIGHVHDAHPYLHAISPSRVKDVYNQTTVVNNYGVGANNTIFNQGIAVDRVAAASHSEIQKIAIQSIPTTPGRVIKPDHLQRVGSSTVLYRPELQAPPKSVRPVAQKIDERHAIIRPAPRRSPSTTPAQGQPVFAKPTPPAQPAPQHRALVAPVAPSAPPNVKTESPKGRDQSTSSSKPAPAAPVAPAPAPPARPVSPPSSPGTRTAPSPTRPSGARPFAPATSPSSPSK
jgi:hypothetical protein